jgi:5-methyltetrahydropteroyltriglutamate--homocysteine methyltransferase
MAGNELAQLRVDQVGSLLRPEALKDAYERHQQGQLSDSELRAAQDDAIREVIARQEALGYSILTDGEYRRLNFQDSFAASVSGFGLPSGVSQSHQQVTAGSEAAQQWNPGYTGAPSPGAMLRRPVVERLHLVRNLPLEEYQFSSNVTDRPVKVTLIGPDRIIQRYAWEDSTAVYPQVEDFIADVVAIEREIVGSLVQADCRYVHIDAPGYLAYVDQPSLEAMRARGEDPDRNLERSMAADNAVIADFPEVTFGIHLCRGNQQGRWHREGFYDAIAERLFNTLGHQRLLLEYDTERAGSFEPLRFVPRDKIVVLGLVSTKSPELESADALKRRIEEATRYLPIEQLALSPQCGFASDIEGNPLTLEDQWRKLETVRRVAEAVWG